MIGARGGYLAAFNIGSRKDFIREDELIKFKMIEEAGNVLPSFELIFDVRDSSIIPLLAEGNTIYSMLGKDENSITNIRLNILKREKIRNTSATQRVRLVGVFDAVPYMTSATVDTYNGTSLSIIKKLVSKYFRFQTNIRTTDDSMVWVRENISDRAFINRLWLHSHLKSDTLLTGICSDGLFRYSSLKNLLDQDPTWKFSAKASREKNSLTYNGSPKIWSDSGFINHLAGYARSRIIHDVDKISTTYNTPNNGLLMAVSKEAERNPDVGRILSKVSVVNSNIHEQFYQAYDNNVRNLLLLNTLKAKVSFDGEYFPIRLHDIAMFKDDADSVNRESSEDSSGLWVTSKVCRIVTDREFKTIVTLSRDGMNSVVRT
jgi:hypothetical protein